MKIHLMRIGFAALILAGAAHSGAFAQNAARLQAPPITTGDAKTFEECVAMPEQQMHARIACMDVMQKIKLTNADMALIKHCRSSDAAMQEMACIGMKNQTSGYYAAL